MLNDLLYDAKIWIDFSSVLSQSTRLTDGRTDRHLSRDYTALHSMQRGKIRTFTPVQQTIMVRYDNVCNREFSDSRIRSEKHFSMINRIRKRRSNTKNIVEF